jgi:hypothetical protein
MEKQADYDETMRTICQHLASVDKFFLITWHGSQSGFAAHYMRTCS